MLKRTAVQVELPPLQCEGRLASIQKEMRHAPLEDPTISRAAALSTALAKELGPLFTTISQKACFAQLTAAAMQHGLQRVSLPVSLLKVDFSPLCIPSY